MGLIPSIDTSGLQKLIDAFTELMKAFGDVMFIVMVVVVLLIILLVVKIFSGKGKRG